MEDFSSKFLFLRKKSYICSVRFKQTKHRDMTTKVEMKNSSTMIVNGSFEEVKKEFEEKGAVLFESRINDNVMIQINGVIVGEIVNSN